MKSGTIKTKTHQFTSNNFKHIMMAISAKALSVMWSFEGRRVALKTVRPMTFTNNRHIMPHV